MGRHRRFALLSVTTIGAALGASCSPPAPLDQRAAASAEARATAPDAGAATAPIAARCGPDYLRRQPDALADLDRDGSLERVSVVREGRKLTVRLHRVPGLVEKARFSLDGDYVEVGATRCKGRTAGDLWLHVGVALDPKGNAWSHALYHLAGGKLEPAIRGIKQSNLFFDLDGDGCVDPLVLDDAGKGRALVGGVWQKLPAEVEPMGLGGRPFGYGQKEAVDLDGDGDLDLTATRGTELRIVHARDFSTVWSLPGTVWSADVTTWGGKTVLVANVGGLLQVLAPTAAHERLASFKSESYFKLVPEIDPKGDGTVLAIRTLDTELLPAAAPAKLLPLGLSFGLPADYAEPRLGPVRFAGGAEPEVLAVRVVERGHPMIAFAGSEASYELVLLGAGAAGQGRVIHHGKVNGALGVEASPVDLEGDGVFEIVLHESAGYSTCDMKGGGSSSTLYLLDGTGAVRWADEPRHESWDSGSRQLDLEAHARPLDLWGDGRRAIRIRAGDRERYLLPAGASVPQPIPVCLE